MMNRHTTTNRKPAFVCDRSSMDSAHGSHNSFSLSQPVLSQQSEFSQVNTQDMFTQSFTVSETDNSVKKMSIYDKWLSKRSLKSDSATVNSGNNSQGVTTPRYNGQRSNIRSDHFSTRNVLKPSIPESRQGTNGLFRSIDPSSVSLTQAINHTKATVQEERDHVEQMHREFMESKAQVISMLSTVKERMDNTDESNDQLGKIVTTFLDDIWKHEEKIMATVLEQNKTKASVAQLEQQLAEKQLIIDKKECQITSLQENLVEAKNMEVIHLAKAVKNEMTSPFVALEQKLEDVLKWANESKEHNVQLFNDCKNSMDSQRKQGQASMKDLEKRLLAEIRKIPQKSSISDSITQLKEDVQQCIDTSISNMEHHFQELGKRFSSQSNSSNKNAGFLQQKTMIQDVLRKSMESVSSKMENLFYNHVDKQDEQLSELQKVLVCHVQQLTARQTPASSLLTLLDNRLSSYRADMKHCLAEVETKCLKKLESFPRFREGPSTQCRPEADQNCSSGRNSTEHLSDVTNPRAHNDKRISVSTAACDTCSVKDKKSSDYHHGSFKEQINAYALNQTDPSCGDKSKNDQEFGADILQNKGQSGLYLLKNQTFCGTSKGNYIQNSIPFSSDQPVQTRRKNEQEENIYKQKSAPFVSPFRSDEHLFKAKTGPSPVAAIMPQRHIERSEETALTLGDISQTRECQKHEPRLLDTKQQTKQKKKKPKRRIFTARKKQKTRSTCYVMEEEEATVIVDKRTSFHTDPNEIYNPISVTARAYQCFPSKKPQPFDRIGNVTAQARKQICMSESGEHKTAIEDQLSVYDFNDCESRNTTFTSKKRTYPWTSETTCTVVLKRSPAQNSNVEEPGSRFSSPAVSLENLNIKRKMRNTLRTPVVPSRSLFRGQSMFNSVRKPLAYSPAPTLLSELTT